MTRRILITLGGTTDADRCGNCPSRANDWCELFDGRLYREDPERGPLRRDECVEAEKAALCDCCEDPLPSTCPECLADIKKLRARGVIGG